jgi:hypothetical protein
MDLSRDRLILELEIIFVKVDKDTNERLKGKQTITRRTDLYYMEK